MKVLFDTNVILDVLLAREPHAEVAARLLNLVDRGRIEGVVGATTLTTIHYLATKAVGRRQAKKHVGALMAMFEVAPVDHGVLARALDLGLPDYEDAVLHEAGRAAGVAGIVTRNGKDFRGAPLPIFTPRELLAGVVASGT
jgi:predicted nucleic acid-binding protein